MAVGFRKSLFGFNCSDVMEYIEKTHKGFSIKQSELSAQVDSLSKELNLTKEGYNKLHSEKEKIEAELNKFTEKYEDIQRLSENIGKLYLVAQANAQSIMAASEENAGISQREVSKNLESIKLAHVSLEELKENIETAANEFADKLNELIASLDDVKSQITQNTNLIGNKKEDFKSLFQSITK